MKRIIYSLVIIAFFSCKGKENNQSGGSTDTVNTNSVRTEYTCPMHPEITSDKPDKCSICGMDLEAKS